jgi:pilus assembly protein Flp/PilA
MMQALKQFWHDEEGAAMLEYGLIAALISVASLTALTELGAGVTKTFADIKAKLPQ